jgi:hypothetical protein
LAGDSQQLNQILPTRKYHLLANVRAESERDWRRGAADFNEPLGEITNR